MDENGEFTFYTCYSDLTDRFNLQTKLETQLKNKQMILDSMPGGVTIYHLKKDSTFEVENTTIGYAKMSGYDSVEEFLPLLNENVFFNVLDEDREYIKKLTMDSIKDIRTFYSFFYHIYKKDGSVMLVRLDANRTDENLKSDDLAVFYTVQTPVSEEAQKIISEQKMLTDLINDVPAGVGIYEIENGVLSLTFLNDAFYQLIGSKRESRKAYSGVNTLLAVHPEDLPNMYAAIKKIIEGDVFFSLLYRVRQDNGNWFWLNLVTTVVERRENYIKLYASFTDYNAVVKAQAEVQKSHNILQTALTEANVLMWHYDYKTDCMTDSGTCGKAYGWPKRVEKPQYRIVEEGIIDERDRSAFFAFHESIAKEKPVTGIFKTNAPNKKTPIWLKYTTLPVFDAAGDYIESIGIAVDVSEQKLAERRFENENALRKELIKDCVYYHYINLTQHIVEDSYFLEPLYADFYQRFSSAQPLPDDIYFIDSSIPQKIAVFFSDEHLLKFWQDGLTEQSFSIYQAYVYGVSHFFETKATLWKNLATNDVMALCYTKDVSIQVRNHKIENLLLKEHYEAIAVIDCHNETITIIRDTQVAEIQESSQTSDYKSICQDFSKQFVIPTEKEEFIKLTALQTVKNNLDKNNYYSFAIHVQGQNTSETAVKTMTFYYLDEAHSAILYVIEDSTDVVLKEQKIMEKLQFSLDLAEQATMAKSEFLSRMSHDMRTPMNGILGLASLSESEWDPVVLRKNISQIQDSGKYLLSLINDTLDFQRIETGKMVLNNQIVHVSEIFDSLLSMMTQAAKTKGITFIVNNVNANMDTYVYADPVRVRQIFTNILSNAMKFTPTGGTVTMEIKKLSREGMISHDCVIIRDTGIGMSKEFIENHLFKAFEQEQSSVTSQYAGSGLGMSIVHNLIQMMGGTIKVESELGKGTTFTVMLDFQRVNSKDVAQDVSVQKKHLETSTKSLAGAKILLVEDHPLNIQIAKKLLEKVGCIIHVCTNGQEAVEFVTNAAENSIDAILMDIRMPVMDGIEATKKIRQFGTKFAENVPIIAITANAFSEDKDATLKAGMNDHLAKPFDPNTLYDVLSRYVGH